MAEVKLKEAKEMCRLKRCPFDGFICDYCKFGSRGWLN